MSEIQRVLSASFVMHDIYREQGRVLDLIAKGCIDMKKIITRRFGPRRHQPRLQAGQGQTKDSAVFVTIHI